MNLVITVFLIRVQSCGIGDNKLNLIITKLYFITHWKEDYSGHRRKYNRMLKNVGVRGSFPLPHWLNTVVYILYTAKQMIKWLLVNHK